jgi:hypothetical protein
MRKGALYMWIFLMLFVSCEEYYQPVLAKIPDTLVVESHLTNDSSQNFVRLSMTRNFYSTDAVEWISGANVELIENGNLNFKGTEISPGYYTFQYTPEVGKTYVLWLSYQKFIYESEPIVMPPLPCIDSLYTKHKIEKNYVVNGYGVPELFGTPSREIYIDASITPELQNYRFTWRAIIQWEYFPPIASLESSSKPLFGWRTKYDLGKFNLAGPAEFSVSNEVRQHPILSLGYDGRQYLDSGTQVPANWIIIVDQFGIPKVSNDFYKKLNSQFAAEGNLFDPAIAQVAGNMHCKNNPSKSILGFFDVSSYRQYRYYFNFGTGNDNEVIQRRLTRYIDIPDHGNQESTHPVFWENNYY